MDSSNASNFLQLGKVRLANNNISFTLGFPQMAAWAGRAVGVTWEISTLENARSYLGIDDSSSFEKQHVLISFIYFHLIWG